MDDMDEVDKVDKGDVQPSLRDLCDANLIPGVETPGYVR